ncbi:MAG: RNA degradosome polyphosphate kinase, partial [Gammaproteobacteria bacterium]|nr:RNA degradosome polyphosphate kinase [Gammaproteobacteria bacterium]
MTNDTQRFINRELSLLAFNHRVLKQAQDEHVPLLERLKFLCISCTNLDEFFEVRVARLKQKVELGLLSPSIDGLTPSEELAAIAKQTHDLVKQQYQTLNENILPALGQEQVNILTTAQWTDDIRRWVHQSFQQQILPVLTPIGLDPARPFPKVFNKSLNFIVHLQGKDAYKRRTRTAIVRAPRSLPRLIRVPAAIGGDNDDFVFLTTVVKQFVGEAFPGMDIASCFQFRVTRNSHLFVDEE